MLEERQPEVPSPGSEAVLVLRWKVWSYTPFQQGKQAALLCLAAALSIQEIPSSRDKAALSG